ncbi:MAG: hypothetical protein Q9195_005930 [Heterodermia aff. obscurata]
MIFNYYGGFQQLHRDNSTFRTLDETGLQPTEEGGPNVSRLSLIEMVATFVESKLSDTLSWHARKLYQNRVKECPELTLFDVPIL